jgi:EAL and modified HD-GYP domain-containing signal transduction protein
VTALGNEAVSNGVKQLAQAGYAISLDDFIYTPESAPLLELAGYAKIDLTKHSKTTLAEQYAHCAANAVTVVAKKVETQEELALCQDIGFDAYQGYFFCQPDIIKGRVDGCNRGVVLNIISSLSEAGASMDDLANVISQDVGLSYKLLRYINCASFSFRREIDTVHEALVMIGTEMVKKWAILILMSNYNQDKPPELSVVAMIRAHMCEQLAHRSVGLNPNQAFTVGLFSTLDAVMDAPMVELLDTIALTSEIKFALLDHEGELGHLLHQVLHYEQGAWSELDTGELQATDYKECYLAAVQWANQSRMLLV